MPGWLSWRRQAESTPSATPSGGGTPAHEPAPAPDQAQLDEARSVQTRLRQDMAELLKANRQQGRVLERNQKQLELAEQEADRYRDRAAAQEKEIAGVRRTSTDQAARNWGA